MCDVLLKLTFSNTNYFAGRSKTKGRQAVESVLALEASLKAQTEAVAQLRSLYLSGMVDLLDIRAQVEDAEQYQLKLRDQHERQYSALGLPEKTEVATLRNNIFLRLRMNALAVKQRLCDRLRQRKFEIEKLERSYRRTANGQSTF